MHARLAVMLVLLAMIIGLPSVASAQPLTAPPPSGPSAATPAAPTELPLRTYDDGLGVEEVPWDDTRRETHYQPLGSIHFGFQLRLAALPGGETPLRTGPVAELAALLDARYDRRGPWRLRIALGVSVQPSEQSLPGAGVVERSSPFAIRTRVFPLGYDFGQRLTARVGLGLGLSWASLPDRGAGLWCPLFENLNELALRVLDGRFEAALSGGFQLTAVAIANRAGNSCDARLQAVVGGSVGYLL